MRGSEVRPDGRRDGQGRRDELVVRTITQHADALLRTARRHSLCDDDAADAYQRAVELFLRNAHRVDPSRADRWLHVVTRREALAVRDLRKRSVAAGETDLDTFESRHTPSPDERVVSFDEVARTAEALQRLKPAEAQALWLRAEGRSYEQIANELGWTRTKVNRCIAEGRARLRARLAGIENGDECARWAPVLSAMLDGEASAADLAALRPHLRNCAGCRSSVRAMHEGAASLGVLLPAGAGVPAGADPVVDLVAGAERAGTGAGVRLHELLLGAAQERMVSGVVKVQALADVLSASKVAAVAASAAAIAGGGVAVEHVARPDAPRPAEARSAVPATTTAERTPAAVAPATAPVPASTPAGPAVPTATERRAVRERRQAAEERRTSDFGPGVVETSTPSRPARAATGPGATEPSPGTPVAAPEPAASGPGRVVAPAPAPASDGPGTVVSGSAGSGALP